MANVPLTAVKVENASAIGKVYYLSDTGGLRLKVDKAGRKYWDFRFMWGEGNQRKQASHRIGAYPQLSLKEARDKRNEVIEGIQEGVDPRLEKKIKRLEKRTDEARAALRLNGVTTFRDVAEQWITSRSDPNQTKQPWDKKTLDNTEGRFANHVYDDIGNLPIEEVTSQMILIVLKKLNDAGKTYSRNKAQEQISNIYRYAKTWGLCQENPADIDMPSVFEPHQEEHFVALPWEQIHDLWYDIDHWEGAEQERQRGTVGLNPTTRILIKLSILTLARPGEIRKAEWSEFNFKERLWTVPNSRMKFRRKNRGNHFVPLSEQAILILKELKKITGHCKHLFPQIRGKGNVFNDAGVLSENTARSACHRMGYKIHAHGFRHMASTFLNEQYKLDKKGKPDERMFDKDWVEYALSHIDKDKTRGTYNNAKYLEPRANMLQFYADQIAPLPQAPRLKLVG
tara:strand:+ start:3220 stop:4584 length:1365 start_codon:yes stop_codon:yes gene_type:complete